ncbi:MAG TPA: hypothetical protein VMF61_01610 [Candidatus Acidoferrales bacterium]|nr:hypothetical protein [Candidatus Acidoferrales bacterium]
MERNRGFSAIFDWLLARATGMRTPRRRIQATFAVGPRLEVHIGAGTCRIVGASVTAVELDMTVKAFTDEEASRVSYTTQERDGITKLLIDGPFSGSRNLATVDLALRVPRGVRVDVHSSMGTVKAQDVDQIGVHASMGAVEIANAHADTYVDAQMGAVRVALAPDWRGSGIALNASMGAATLLVPAGVHLNCEATSSLGSVKVGVGSYPDAPTARVSTSMGAVRIAPG